LSARPASRSAVRALSGVVSGGDKGATGVSGAVRVQASSDSGYGVSAQGGSAPLYLKPAATAGAAANGAPRQGELYVDNQDQGVLSYGRSRLSSYRYGRVIIQAVCSQRSIASRSCGGTSTTGPKKPRSWPSSTSHGTPNAAYRSFASV
jgi:hypothetical protein